MAEMANPFNIGIVPKTLTNEELARAIRMDMAAEIEAINLYEAHIAATDNEHAKRVIGHIMEEEKQHLIEFYLLLKQLDPDQIGAEAEAEAEFPEVEAGIPVDNQPEALAQVPSPPGLTVGSLIGKDQTP